MRVRAPSEARNTDPRSAVVGRLRIGAVAVPAVLAVVVPLGVVSQADASSAPPSHRTGVPQGRVAAVGASTPHALAPRVHHVVIPAVPAAKRMTLSQRTAPRRVVTAQQDQSARQAKPAPLVAHIRSRVSSGFSMLGVTWDHGAVDPSTVEVAVRTRDPHGWTPWTAVDVDPDEGPAAGEDSSVRDGTAPLYVGQADAVEVAVYDANGHRPSGLTVAAIDPGTTAYDATAAGAASASSAKGGTTSTTDTAKDQLPVRPRIVTRKQWGADESLGDTCWSPRFGNTFKAVFVHHTAGSNTYTRRESASVVRGIYAYHTQSRGWCDIGYNFLIDRYGTVYEGRAGGIRKPVRGAHAGDYNVNSTGISLMGEFTNTMPTKAMRAALVRLVAWRLGTAYRSGVGHAYINGKRFAQISGHRDAMATACPGEMVYDWLPTLRRKVHKRLDGFTSVIERHWLNRGGAKGALGPVRMGEVAADGGRHTTFTKARTYFKNGRRVTLRPSPLLTAYVAKRETAGELGYPRSRLHHPGKGLSAFFEGGRLYWHEKTGAHVVLSGKVLVRYRHLHGPSGRLGFPKTDLRTTDVSSYARFQHGTITYDKSTGQTTVSYR